MKSSLTTCLLAALLALILGCGDPPVAMVKLGEATPERRMEFAKGVEKALKDFDDLYNKFTSTVSVGKDGMPRITVKSTGSGVPKLVEQPLAVVLTNLAIRYPGISYMALDTESWEVLLPAEIPVELDKPFRFSIP